MFLQVVDVQIFLHLTIDTTLLNLNKHLFNTNDIVCIVSENGNRTAIYLFQNILTLIELIILV